MTWSSNDTSINQQSFFERITYNLTEVVQHVYIHYLNEDEYHRKGKLIDLTNSPDSFEEKTHRNFGRCYTFHPDIRIRQLGVAYVQAKL